MGDKIPITMNAPIPIAKLPKASGISRLRPCGSANKLELECDEGKAIATA
jgi:hypothetical protein